jgi:hypothetical protein
LGVTLVNGILCVKKEKTRLARVFSSVFPFFSPHFIAFYRRQRRHGDQYDFSSPSRWFRPQFDGPVTVASGSSIGTSLAKAALAGKVDGKLVDTSYLIDKTSIWPSSPTRMPKAWR